MLFTIIVFSQLLVRAMASLSEEVLLVVKKVRQKKQDGTLYLMAERIAWGPEGKDRFTVSHLYADIRCKSQITSLKCLRVGGFYRMHFTFALQVRRSVLMAKPKFSFNWSFTPVRAQHSTLPMRALQSKTERLPRNCCSSYCQNSRRKPTKNWRRKTGMTVGCFTHNTSILYLHDLHCPNHCIP